MMMLSIGLFSMGTWSSAQAAVRGPVISPILVGNNLWYYPDAAALQITSKAGLKIVRIGGSELDSNMPSNAQLTTWVNQIKAMGAEPLIQVSQYRSAADAAAVVKYLNFTINNPVKYWSIGNEPLCQNGRPDDRVALAKAVAGYVKSAASAMKAVDPSIKIFAPDECAYFEDMYNALLGGAADITGKDSNGRYYIDGISWHRYSYNDDLVTTGANGFLADIQNIRTRIDYANNLQGRTSANALQFGIGEFNANADAGWPCLFANGQMFAQIYGYMMKYGGIYATTWSIKEGGSKCSGTDFGFLNGDNSPRPSYYHMQMVSQNFSGIYVNGASNVGTMRTYGAVDTSKIAAMLVNVGSAQTCSVRLNNDVITGSCQVNIDADIPVTSSQTIGGQTTIVLVFNLQGQLIKRVTYASSSGGPITENFTSGSAVGVFRAGTWYLDANGNGAWDGCQQDGGLDLCLFGSFGQAGDLPAAGNWSGGTKSSIGVLRSGTGQWFIDRNGNHQWDGCVVDGCYSGFGAPGDLPVAGDWNGTGFAKIGVFSNGQWFLDANGNGAWDGCGTDLCLNFGQMGDWPVAGNWDGGLKAGVGVFRAGTWYLDYNGNGKWDGCQQDGGQDLCLYNSFGQVGDLPAAGDWNGDGKAKVGVFRNGTWYLDYNGNGAWDGCAVDRCYVGSFGIQGDLPVAGRW